MAESKVLKMVASSDLLLVDGMVPLKVYCLAESMVWQMAASLVLQ